MMVGWEENQSHRPIINVTCDFASRGGCAASPRTNLVVAVGLGIVSDWIGLCKYRKRTMVKVK